MNLVGTVEKGEDIIKAHGSTFMRFNIAYFDNEFDSELMHGEPFFDAVIDQKLGHPVFHIYKPVLNQLFKYNDSRVPYALVEQVEKGNLHFAIVFNNELVLVDTILIFNLQQTDQEDWKKQEKMIPIFNSMSNRKEKR